MKFQKTCTSFILGLVLLCATGFDLAAQTGPRIENTTLIYALPRTRIVVQLTATQTITKKGPYADFATRMLGLPSVPRGDSEMWTIENVRITEHTEADVSRLCGLSFTTFPENLQTFLKVLPTGIVSDLSATGVTHNYVDALQDVALSEYAHLSASQNATEKTDTFYKTIMTDTAFVRVPVLQTQIFEKTLEERAQEVVDQLYELRDRRFRLLIGDVDSYPEGAALKLALDALEKQEEQLMSLFVGAKAQKTIQYSISFIPQKPGTEGPLFYFSDTRGFSNRPGTGYREYYYETGKVDTMVSPVTETTDQSMLYYRFAVPAEISVGSSAGILARKTIPVYQFGPLGMIPLVQPTGRR